MNTTQPRYTPDAEFPFDYDERTKQRLRWLRQATAAIEYHRERDALAYKWPQGTWSATESVAATYQELPPTLGHREEPRGRPTQKETLT